VGRILVEQGHIPPPDPEAPGIFAMADQGRIRELVMGAGFVEPEIEEVSFRWSFADQDTYWRFLTEAAGPSLLSCAATVFAPRLAAIKWGLQAPQYALEEEDVYCVVASSLLTICKVR
jgi:hypothetical protein